MSTSYLKPRRKFCSSKILGEVSSFQLSSMERRPESSLKDQCQTTQAKKHHQKVLLKAEPAGFPLKISQVSKNSNIIYDIKMSFNHIQSKLLLYLILLEIPPWLLKRQLLVLQNRTWAENHEIVINVVPEKQTSKFDTALNRSKNTTH